MRKIQNQKCNSLLPFKIPHKFHLMCVNILQGEIIRTTFFRIKAYRYSLHSANIVHGTFLVEICQSNMPALLVDTHRRNGSRHFLNKRQSLFPILLAGSVNKFL